MKYKLLFILLTLLFMSCANLASPVNNVTIIKIQFGANSEMAGSQLEKIAEGLTQKAGDVTGKVK